MKKFSVLIIDDEESILVSLKSFLVKRDYLIYTASDGKAGIEIAKNNLVDVVLTDFRMPEWDGIKVLEEIKKLNPNIDVVMITAFGKLEDAVDVMKLGAYDYLTKPIDLDDLENILNRIKEKQLLVTENKLLREELKEKYGFDSIISRNKEMEEVLNTSARVAGSKATVLIRGESGTGKELVARGIHLAGDRGSKPFVTVNVAALSDNLMESELFGHEKGSFTGATGSRKGRFEEADGGTIFIDEVGDIPLSVQVKLLRVVQFNEIQRLGSNQNIKIDVRIIAATHRNLEEMIERGEFREDLYYRLNVIALNLPPLRRRKTDIPVLIDHFIKKYSSENGRQINGINREALDQLMKYSFPGNIRELENIIERAILLSRTEFITENDIPDQIEKQAKKSMLDPCNFENPYDEKVKSFEREIINEALQQTGGNKSAAARLLQITERHLRSRLERLEK